MQAKQEGQRQLKEDFFVRATIKIDAYEIPDIPCKIYLPQNPLSKPRLEFKPNYEQWQQVRLIWRAAFEARTIDRLGRTIALISAPEVYLKNMWARPWGPDLYDCAFDGEAQDLRVVQYLKSSAEDSNSEANGFCLWISPNTMLRPTIVENSSYTGNIEIKRVTQLRFSLTPDIHLDFDMEYRHRTLPTGERLQWSILVANLECGLPNQNIDVFNSSIMPIVDDFLWVAGLGSRTRTACIGWAASDSQTYTRYYRGNLVFPTGKQEPSFDDGLVARADYEEFLSKSWGVFNHHAGKDAIKGSIQALLPNRQQILEESFLSLFAGLEELILDYRVRNDLEFIISEKSAWNKIRTSIESVIKNFSDPKIEKHHRSLFYAKLGELNRVPLQYAFERFCSEYAIDSADLWPVFSNTDGVGLSNVRNKLIHGDRFPETMINALSIARDNLKWVLERAVIGVLKWPLEKTDVAPGFLSAGATSFKEMAGARKRLSEYLGEKPAGN